MRKQVGDMRDLSKTPTAPKSAATPAGAGERGTKRFSKKIEPPQNKRSFGKKIFVACLFLMLFSVIGGGLVGYWALFTSSGEAVVMTGVEHLARKIDAKLPNDAELKTQINGLQLKQQMDATDRDGLYIGTLGDEKRALITREEIPEWFIDMLAAQENKTFRTDRGIYLPRVAAAVVMNRFRKQQSGGSTITQQLIKRTVVGDEKSLSRKIRELYLAYRLSFIFSKDEIVVLYSNTTDFNGPLGFKRAAQHYFGVEKFADLRKDQAAVLIQMLRGPAKYSPIKHPAAAKAGRDLVLSRMVSVGKLDRTAAEDLKKLPIEVVKSTTTTQSEAPECLDEARRELQEKYGEGWLYMGGTVKSTCSLKVVRAMRASMIDYLAKVDAQNGELPAPDAAAIVIDSVTGELIGKVVVGYTLGGLDLTKAPRQFGSLAKPFYYAKAFEEGFTPATLMWDSQLPLPPAKKGAKWWSPNSHSPTQQPMRLRMGLAESKNTLASRLVYDLSDDNDPLLGTKKVIEQMKVMGIDLEQMNTKKDKEGNIEKKFEPEYSLVLGASNADLTRLVRAYAAFDNGGQLIKIHSLLEVNGQKVVQEPSTQVIDAALAYQTRNVLETTVEEGTGRFAKGKGIKWGKSGTTNANTDALFIGGYDHGLKGQDNSRLMFGVWMGFKSGSISMGKDWEGAKTLRMAVKFLPDEVKSAQPIVTAVPQGVVAKMIDPMTGLCVEDGAPGAIREVFLERTLPIQCGGSVEARLEKLPPKMPEGAKVEGGGEVHATPEKPAGQSEVAQVPARQEQETEKSEGSTEQQSPETPGSQVQQSEAQPEESGN